MRETWVITTKRGKSHDHLGLGLLGLIEHLSHGAVAKVAVALGTQHVAALPVALYIAAGSLVAHRPSVGVHALHQRGEGVGLHVTDEVVAGHAGILAHGRCSSLLAGV